MTTEFGSSTPAVFFTPIVKDALPPESMLSSSSTVAVLGRVLLATCVWEVVYRLVANRIIAAVLPRYVLHSLRERQREKPGLGRLCRVNATAFAHAVAVAPLALVVYWNSAPDKGISALQADAPLFHTLGVWACGYFLWDFRICLRYLKDYGYAFLIHAVVSFACLFVQVTASELPLTRIGLAVLGTEFSTIFLHLRWYCTAARTVNGLYFKLANVLFIVTFCATRLVFIHVAAIGPLLQDIWENGETSVLDPWRKALLVTMIVVWTVLNYYWGFLLLKSQWKHRQRPSRRRVSGPAAQRLRGHRA